MNEINSLNPEATVRPDFQHWATGHQQRIETRLQAVLPNPEVAPPRLHEAMRYAVLGSGKRVRPLLAFAAGEVTGADAGRVEIAGAAYSRQTVYVVVIDLRAWILCSRFPAGPS